MYLHNLKTRAPLPFIYELSYDVPARAICFNINPTCISIFKQMNPENLILRCCQEIFGLTEFEPDIEKNFGLQNSSINPRINQGFVSILFP